MVKLQLSAKVGKSAQAELPADLEAGLLRNGPQWKKTPRIKDPSV
jgi:hypothetical protein